MKFTRHGIPLMYMMAVQFCNSLLTRPLLEMEAEVAKFVLLSPAFQIVEYICRLTLSQF